MNDICCGVCGGHDIRERPNGAYYCPDCSRIHKHDTEEIHHARSIQL